VGAASRGGEFPLASIGRACHQRRLFGQKLGGGGVTSRGPARNHRRQQAFDHCPTMRGKTLPINERSASLLPLALY
jgi:hypothetical protein